MNRRDWMEILKKNKESAAKAAGKAEPKNTPSPAKDKED